MASQTTLNLEFSDFSAMEIEPERVRAILVRIENELDSELEELFFEHAEMVKALAQTYVRIDTGSLQKSIRVEHLAKHHIAVRAGGYVVNPKTKRLVDYAGYVEEKYPYLTVAYEQVLPQLNNAVDDLMRKLTR